MTASVETAWWVVTDLDGTLLDHRLRLVAG
jgi:hydroxymethylpyrimidine pyrophosphatase-like HAD family hydrolase